MSKMAEDSLIRDVFSAPAAPARCEVVISVTGHDYRFLRRSDFKLCHKGEAGRGSGVLRPDLSDFWKEFYQRCALGTTV